MAGVKHSVPDTYVQGRARFVEPRDDSERVCCVACGVEIRHGSWCNDCREREISVLRVRFPGLARQVLSMKLNDLGGECECGNPCPKLADRCAHCAWLESEDWLSIAQVDERTEIQRFEAQERRRNYNAEGRRRRRHAKGTGT